MERPAIPPGGERPIRTAWGHLNAGSLSAAAAAGRSWGRRLGLSLADQGLVSSSHFLLNVMLARLLRPADYGAFATAYTAFLFLAGVHTALVAEPASVLGPARHSDRLDGYLRAAFRLDLGLCAALAAALLLVAAGLTAITSGGALIVGALAIATPLMLVSQLLRRACYVAGEVGRATAGSVCYAVAVVAAVLLISRPGLASPVAGLLALAAAAAVSLLVYLPRFRSRDPVADPGPASRELLRENWTYGRWMLAAGVAHWLGPGLYIPALAALVGLEAAGGFRAMMNLVTPFEQALVALGLLVLPRLAQGRSATGSPGRPVAALWLSTALLALPYALLLIVLGRPLIGWLYGGGSYLGFADLLPVFVAYVAVLSVSHGLALQVRADERTPLIFRSKLAAAAVSMTVGLGLALAWGARGAAVGLALAVGAECLVLAAGRRFRGKEPQR